MKHLKKHPKQQRMEDMTFPLHKPGRCFYHPKETAVVESGTANANLCQGCLRTIFSDKVTWEGREWLRSVNDDNGFTLMPRIVWRVVAVVLLLVVAIIYCVLLLL